MKKTGTFITLCAGGITIGAAASITAILLTSGGGLSDLSEKEAFKQGIEYLFSNNECDDSFVKALSQITSVSNETDISLNINKIYSMNEFDNSSYKVSLRSDNENIKYSVDASIDTSSTDPFTFSGYLDSELFGATSSSIDAVVYATLSDILGDESLEDYISSLDEFDSSTIKNDMIEIYNKGLEKIYENMDVTKDETKEDINGVTAYCFTAQIKTTDIIEIAYNEVQFLLTNEDFREYLKNSAIYKSYLLNSAAETINGDSIDEDYLDNMLTKASLGLTMYYQEISKTVTDIIGDTVEANMYLTNDVEVARFIFTINDLSSTYKNIYQYVINYSGKDNLKDEQTHTILNKYQDKTDEIAFYLSKEDSTTNLSLSASHNDVSLFKISCKYVDTDGAFSSHISVSKELIEVATIDIEGSYEISNDKCTVNINKFIINSSAIDLFDATATFSIYKTDEEITMPKGELVDYFSLTDDEANTLMNKIFNIEE